MTRVDAVTWVSRYASKTKGLLPWACRSPYPNDVKLRAATKGALIFKVEKRFEELTAAKWRERILNENEASLQPWSTTITIDQIRRRRP